MYQLHLIQKKNFTVFREICIPYAGLRYTSHALLDIQSLYVDRRLQNEKCVKKHPIHNFVSTRQILLTMLCWLLHCLILSIFSSLRQVMIITNHTLLILKRETVAYIACAWFEFKVCEQLPSNWTLSMLVAVYEACIFNWSRTWYWKKSCQQVYTLAYPIRGLLLKIAIYCEVPTLLKVVVQSVSPVILLLKL